MKKRSAIIVAVIATTTLWSGMAFAISGTNPLPRTGQGEGGKCYNTANGVAVEIPCAGTRQDGETKKGVAWPGTRFTDNGNGTVTDNLTGLIWLKNLNCFGGRNRDDANNQAAALANGACGLSDGSVAGNWRVPNIKELESLVDLSRVTPAIAGGSPFISFPGDGLWRSSTARASNPTYYNQGVNLNSGNIQEDLWIETGYYVLPVKNSP